MADCVPNPNQSVYSRVELWLTVYLTLTRVCIVEHGRVELWLTGRVHGTITRCARVWQSYERV